MHNLIKEMLDWEPELPPETYKAVGFLRHMMTKDHLAFDDWVAFRGCVERTIKVMARSMPYVTCLKV